MNLDQALSQQRLLLYYKGDISALTLFAQQENAGVLFPEALPQYAEIIDGEAVASSKISLHPAVLLNHINGQLQLDNDLLRLEPNFCEHVLHKGNVIKIYLARFMLLDPPHKLLASRQCRMRTLPELRNCPMPELELLRRAYVKVMEG